MFSFKFRTMLLVAILVFLLVAVIVHSYTLYSMANSAKFVITSGTNVVTTKGVEAIDFWSENKLLVAAPTAINLLGMAMIGLAIYID